MSQPVSTLAANLKAAFDAEYAKQAPGEQGMMTALSNAMATAIDSFVKSHNATGSDSGGDSHNLTIV